MRKSETGAQGEEGRCIWEKEFSTTEAGWRETSVTMPAVARLHHLAKMVSDEEQAGMEEIRGG